MNERSEDPWPQYYQLKEAPIHNHSVSFDTVRGNFLIVKVDILQCFLDRDRTLLGCPNPCLQLEID